MLKEQKMSAQKMFNLRCGLNLRQNTPEKITATLESFIENGQAMTHATGLHVIQVRKKPDANKEKEKLSEVVHAMYEEAPLIEDSFTAHDKMMMLGMMNFNANDPEVADETYAALCLEHSHLGKETKGPKKSHLFALASQFKEPEPAPKAQTFPIQIGRREKKPELKMTAAQKFARHVSRGGGFNVAVVADQVYDAMCATKEVKGHPTSTGQKLFLLQGHKRS